MKKPVFGMVLGGVLGVFDGLTALLSAPETRPAIMGIVIGWVLGSRAARDAYAMEMKRREERAARKSAP